MGRNDYWVEQRDDGTWEHKRVNASRASGVHDTQAEAWKAARGAAKNAQSEAFLTNRHHVIIERNTYHKDPFPPQG